MSTPPPTGAPRQPDPGALPEAAETLLDVLDWHVEQHPERVHVRFLAGEDDVQDMSYAALRRASDEVAAGLRQRGVTRGKKVGIMLPTSLDFFHAFFGILIAGGVPVPIYPPARREQIEQLLRRQASVLDNAEAVVLITVPEAQTAARFLRAKARQLSAVATVPELRAAPATPRGDGPVREDLAFLQYTSGSTGAPKGVMLTHANLLANVRALGIPCGWDGERDVFVSWLPLYHDMGLIGAWLGSLYHGSLLVLMSPLRFLTRPERWLWAIDKHRGTITAAPNFAYELCRLRIKEQDLRGLDLSSMRVMANGAEPVLPATLRSFQARFAPYGLAPTAQRPVYGLAENSVGLTLSSLTRPPRIDRIRRDLFTQTGSAQPAESDDATALEFVACGSLLAGHQIRVVDAQSVPVPDRQSGAIQFRGPSATQGYYRNAEATRALFDGDWVRTGDRGYQTDGDLFIAGREKDIIIRAGRNLHAPEIEAAASSVSGIRSGCVAAFGMTGPGGTEQVVVLAETRETLPTSMSALRDAVRRAIIAAIGEPPDEIVLVPPHVVLKTSSGKVRRSDTRGLYERGEHLRSRPPPWVQVVRLALAAVRAEARALFGRLGRR